MTRLCLLVEDQVPNQFRMREALTAAFPGIMVEVAGSVREAMQWLNNRKTDDAFTLAVIDLGLPDGSGIDVIAAVSQNWPGVMSIVSSIYDDDRHLFDALAAGAKGYLVKDHEPDMIVHYLRRIDQGEPPLSPSIAIRLLSHFRNQAARPDGDDVALTGRETETLTLLAKGLTIAEAARQLQLSPTTVAGYVRIIYQKLNVSTRAEAVLHAVRRGLA